MNGPEMQSSRVAMARATSSSARRENSVDATLSASSANRPASSASPAVSPLAIKPRRWESAVRRDAAVAPSATTAASRSRWARSSLALAAAAERFAFSASAVATVSVVWPLSSAESAAASRCSRLDDRLLEGALRLQRHGQGVGGDLFLVAPPRSRCRLHSASASRPPLLRPPPLWRCFGRRRRGLLDSWPRRWRPSHRRRTRRRNARTAVRRGDR